MKKILLLILALNIYAIGFSQNANMGNTLNSTLPCSVTTNIVSQTNVSCFGGNNGSLTISASNGTGAYTYSWSPTGGTSATAINLSAGTYTCLVKDANLCASTRTVVITQPSQLVSAISSFTNVTCFGLSSGAASVVVVGGTTPYTYTWTPGMQTNSTMVNVPASTYLVNVKDAKGCLSSQQVVISQPTALSFASSSFTNTSCFGGNDGKIATLVQGGSPGYTYSWAPSGSGSVLAGLAAGGYTVTVSDTKTCTTSASFSIASPPPLSSTYMSTTATCGLSNASASITASGGSGTYTYSWVPTGGNSSTATNLSAGTYTCTIKDAKNCTINQQIAIGQSTTSSINNTTNLVSGTLSSNQYNATYQWINCGTGNSNVSGATTQTFTPVINGSYAVIINYNGCTATSSCTTISNVGIEEYQLASHVSVSPNPSTSQFNFNGLVGENTIQITDITGRVLLTEKTFTENHTLKLDAAQGIYFYKITDKQNRVQQGKLLVQ